MADHEADVVVVGGGVAGLCVGLALMKAGVPSVTLLEGRAVGAGNTGRTTAHLMPWLDDGLQSLARSHGAPNAAHLVAAQLDALAWIEATVRAEGIACHHARVPGYLFAQSPENENMLEGELAAARSAGMEPAEVDWEDCGRGVGGGGGGIGRALHFTATAEVSPLLYVQGLAAAFERRGGRIFEGTRVKTYETHAGGGQGGFAEAAPPAATIRLRDAPALRVTARSALVLATCAPCNRDLAIHARQSAWRSYVVGLAVPKSGAPGAPRHACWWTVDEAEYKYVRLAVDESPGASTDVLLVGGEDHEAAQAPPLSEEEAGGSPWDRLEAWARARWPGAGARTHAWSGIVYEPADGVGLVGWSPADGPGRRVFVVSGDSGQGFTNAAVGALLAAAAIGGAPTPAWAGVFDPARLMAAHAPRLALPGLAHEGLATLRGLVKSRLVPSLTDIEALGPGCGGVGQAGLTGKVAAYVAGDGTRTLLSGTCPHMGCVLTYNGRERVFDCPCHGSCFDREGVCIQGPATSDLARIGRGEGSQAAEE